MCHLVQVTHNQRISQSANRANPIHELTEWPKSADWCAFYRLIATILPVSAVPSAGHTTQQHILQIMH